MSKERVFVKVRSMIAALGAVAALALAVVAPEAQGMAMYNNSSWYGGGTSVNFVCGFFCGWVGHAMPYHQPIAYPGKGGSFELTQDGCTMSSGHPNIEDHGYAELTGEALNSDTNDVKWNMWGNSNNPISGSPWNVVCAPTPESRRLSSSPRPADSPWIDRQFRAWDADRNGSLSIGELRAGTLRDFHRIDLNHDGVIDARDIRRDLAGQSAAHRRIGKAVLPFDLDGDGKVPPGEYWRYVQRTFVRPIGGASGGPITLGQATAFYAPLSP